MASSTKWISGLVFLLFLFGCSQEASTGDRLLCMELASYSNAEIPYCKSQEKCFELVESSFDAEENLFSAEVQQVMHEYKNRVARSWLYFSRAKDNLKEIYALCSNQQSLSELPRQINELNHHLVGAFEEVDALNGLAYYAMFLERAELEGEEIEKIREEKLFDDFTALNNNILQLANPQMENAGGFASMQFSRAAEFQKFSEALGFEQRILKESTLADLIKAADKKLSPSVPKKPFFVPIIGSSVSSVANFFADSMTLSDAVSALQHFPSFELLNSLNGFVGVGDSTTLYFFDLMNRTHKHKQELMQRNHSLEEEISVLLEDSREKIELIDSASYRDFDEDFLAELISMLSQETIIVSQEDAIKGISTAKEEGLKKLFEFNSRIQALSTAEALGQISLGEKTLKLKQLLLEAKEFHEELEFFSDEAISTLVGLCESRISLVEQQLNKISFGEQENFLLSDLASVTRLRVNRFNSSTRPKEKLQNCKPVFESFASLKAALGNPEVFRLEQANSVKECIDFLERAFSSSESDAFSELQPLFNQLKFLDFSSSPFILSSCENLREKVESSLSELPEAESIAANHSASQRFVELLGLLETAKVNGFSAEELFGLRQRFEGESTFFDGPQLNFSKALGKLKQLNESSFKLRQDSKKTFLESLQNYLQENAGIELFSDSIPKTNEPFSARKKFTLRNNLAEFDGPLQLRFETKDSGSAVFSHATPNVKSVSLSNGVMIVDLNFVPLGLTVFSVDFNSVPATATHVDELLFLDSDKALFEREILIEAPALIPKLLVLSEFNPALTVERESITVIFREKQLQFHFLDGKLAFFAESVAGKEKARVFFNVLKPVEVEFNEPKLDKVDENRFDYTFPFSVKNKLAFELKKAKVLLPFPIKERNIAWLKAFDSTGKSIPVEVISDESVSVTFDELPPNQPKQFFISLEVSNYEQYWTSVLASLKQKVSLINGSNEPSLRAKADLLLGEIEGLEESRDLVNEKSIGAIIGLSQLVASLENEQSGFEQKSQDFLVFERELHQELNQFKGELERLKGFSQKPVFANLFLKDFSQENFTEQMQSSLQKAELHLSKAENLFNEKDLNAAFSELLLARSVIAEKPYAGISGLFLEEKNKLEKLANDFFSKAFSVGLDEGSISTERDELLELSRKAEEAISRQELSVAETLLSTFSEKVFDFNSLLEKSAKEKLNKILERTSAFEELKQLVSEKISLLRSALSSPAIPSNYVAPTTVERLEKLEEKANSEQLLSVSSSISEFMEAINEKEPFKALELSNFFSPELDTAINSLERIEKELAGDLDKLKEDSVSAFNFAAIKYNAAPPNEEARQLIEKAKSELEQSNYVEAINLSSRATGLLSFSNAEQFSVPSAVYPLLGVIAVVAFFRYKKSRQPEKQKLRVEKINFKG